MSLEERVKFIEPIVQANNEQFSRLANTIAEVANFGKTFSNLAASIRLPIIDILDNLKLPELSQISDFYRGIDSKAISFERYDPPVTIKKSKSELELDDERKKLTEKKNKLLSNNQDWKQKASNFFLTLIDAKNKFLEANQEKQYASVRRVSSNLLLLNKSVIVEDKTPYSYLLNYQSVLLG